MRNAGWLTYRVPPTAISRVLSARRWALENRKLPQVLPDASFAIALSWSVLSINVFYGNSWASALASGRERESRRLGTSKGFQITA